MPKYSLVVLIVPGDLNILQIGGHAVDTSVYGSIHLRPGKHTILFESGQTLSFLIRETGLDTVRPRLRNELLIGREYSLLTNLDDTQVGTIEVLDNGTGESVIRKSR